MAKKIFVFSLAVLAMVIGARFAQETRDGGLQLQEVPAPEFQGRLVTPPRTIAMPKLVADDGSAFDNEDVTGHWSLLFFGYANCPDICPMTLNVLAEAKKNASGPFPEVVFVSVDPQRDTVDILGDYVRYFDPSFRGVTGSEEMLKALSLQTSVVYMNVPDPSGNEDNYFVEHSSSLLLLSPEGKLHAFLQAPHTPASILNSLEKIGLN